MLLDGFISLLKANNGITGLVAGAVYKDELPRGYVLPAIVVHRYNGAQEYAFTGPIGLREDQFQFDCYGNDSTSAEQVKELVRELIITFVGPLPDGTKVSVCDLERDMSMPFVSTANTKGIANRALIGVKVVSER